MSGENLHGYGVNSARKKGEDPGETVVTERILDQVPHRALVAQ